MSIRSESAPRTVSLVTLGCARNEVDSEELAARLTAAGWDLTSDGDASVVLVTDAATALQKVERSFAQELLCPFTALDAFTDEHGLDDDGIDDAAEHFGVSQRLILATLVNKHKLGRHRLPAM